MTEIRQAAEELNAKACEAIRTAAKADKGKAEALAGTDADYQGHRTGAGVRLREVSRPGELAAGRGAAVHRCVLSALAEIRREPACRRRGVRHTALQALCVQYGVYMRTNLEKSKTPAGRNCKNK